MPPPMMLPPFEQRRGGGYKCLCPCFLVDFPNDFPDDWRYLLVIAGLIHLFYGVYDRAMIPVIKTLPNLV